MANVLDAGRAHDWWHSDRMVAEELMAEITRLRQLVQYAYNEGFHEGQNQMLLARGGLTWGDSTARGQLVR